MSRLEESSFTYALTKTHDKGFQDKIMPALQQDQNNRSPAGCSQSKSFNLLKNTFSLEVYNEFLKWKVAEKNRKVLKEQL